MVPPRSSASVLRISPTTGDNPLPSATDGSSARTISASSPSSDKSLPRMISFDITLAINSIVGGAGRQRLRKQRLRQLPLLRRLARREQRDQAAGAVDELEIGDRVAQLRELVAVEQVLPLDDDQHVELARRETGGDLLVLLEFGRVGPEQLAQRIVDLEPVEAEHRADHQQGEDDRADDRGAQRDQPDALDPVGQRMQPACGRPAFRRLFRPARIVPSGGLLGAFAC